MNKLHLISKVEYLEHHELRKMDQFKMKPFANNFHGSLAEERRLISLALQIWPCPYGKKHTRFLKSQSNRSGIAIKINSMVNKTGCVL